MSEIDKLTLNRVCDNIDDYSLFRTIVFREGYDDSVLEGDINSVPDDILISYLEMKNSGVAEGYNRRKWDSGVAEDELIRQDLSVLDRELVSERLEPNLLLRIVEGHAVHGHTSFRKNGKSDPKPNTRLEDILRNIGSFSDVMDDPFYDKGEDYLKESQGLIGNVASLLESAVSKGRYMSLDSEKGALLGIPFLKGLDVDKKALLKGYFYGGHFDEYPNIRSVVDDEYLKEGNVGGGESKLVDIDKLKRFGISLDELSHNSYDDDVLASLSPERREDLFYKVGIFKGFPGVDHDVSSWGDILLQGKDISGSDNISSQFYRYVNGRGVSDDIAIMSASMIDDDGSEKDSRWYNGLLVGAYLADFVDTVEKGTSHFIPGGQDTVLAKYIQSRWLDEVKEDRSFAKSQGVRYRDIDKTDPDFALVPKREIINLTAASVNPKKSYFRSSRKASAIHSSQSYFLKRQSTRENSLEKNSQTEEDIVTCAAQQELLYVQSLMPMNNKGYGLSGKMTDDVNVLIGFQRHEIGAVRDYFRNTILPMIKDRNNREKNTKNFYS
ncbi:MAG: hypothetical protein ACQEP1_04385 [Nanobdellota archaeon]